jgi:predicted  nucleic acid-binding Zn-ribbon protein
MAYAEAIPLDLLRSEQARIANEQLAAQRDHDNSQNTAQQIEESYLLAAQAMQQGSAIYAQADDEARRHLNRAFLAKSESTSTRRKSPSPAPGAKSQEQRATFARPPTLCRSAETQEHPQ